MPNRDTNGRKADANDRRAIAKRAGTFHHGDLRWALVQGAMLLLEREGPLAVGLRAAARLAGVSQTAPYRHFADKDAMLAAVAEHGFRELGDRMVAAALENPDPRQALLAIGETYVQLAAERPHLFRLMFGPEVANKDRCPNVKEAGMRAYQVVLDSIAAAQRAGILCKGDPDHIALAHWSCVHGLASLIVDGRLSERLAALGPEGARTLTRVVCEQLFKGCEEKCA
jgi:AcrR family transcriptional regulator